MPSKRTNDSVDRILEDLNIQQAQAGLRDSVTDRQVDEILRSVASPARLHSLCPDRSPPSVRMAGWTPCCSSPLWPCSLPRTARPTQPTTYTPRVSLRSPCRVPGRRSRQCRPSGCGKSTGSGL